MYELETLVVPEELGKWLQSMAIGESGAYFSTIGAMYRYWETVVGSPTGDFIVQNKKELIEVIIGSRGYRIEKEPKYYVLVRDEECGGFWFLTKNSNGKISIGVGRDCSEVDWDRLKLTEQEIKDYDERFWAFAERVEQADFRLRF